MSRTCGDANRSTFDVAQFLKVGFDGMASSESHCTLVRLFVARKPEDAQEERPLIEHEYLCHHPLALDHVPRKRSVKFLHSYEDHRRLELMLFPKINIMFTAFFSACGE